jgi:hypothetical protein
MAKHDPTMKFEGFSSPNFTTVPDEFFDDLVPKLGNAELRVLLYIIRRTFGFKKERDSISLSQMVEGIVRKDGTRLDSGTGLKKAAVCKALSSLERQGIIYRTKQFDFAGGAVATSYQLHMKGVSPAHTPAVRTPVYAGRQGGAYPCLPAETGGVSERGRPLSTGVDTQETVNKKQGDNNVNVPKKAKRAVKTSENPLHSLPDLEQPEGLTDLIARDIVATLGDEHSSAFYHLVARKMPEYLVRKALSEVRQGNAVSPPKVFTRCIMGCAEEWAHQRAAHRLVAERNKLAMKLKAPEDWSDFPERQSGGF